MASSTYAFRLCSGEGLPIWMGSREVKGLTVNILKAWFKQDQAKQV